MRGRRPSSRGPSICYVATYDPEYPRNSMTIRAFREAGARVERAGGRRKSPAAGIWLSRRVAMRVAAGLAVRTALAPFDLGMRLLRCDALIAGYLGQFDMLACAPLAKLLGRPVVFNPLVTLTDTLVEDRRIARPGDPAARLIESIDSAALRMADVLLVDTRANGDYIARRFGVDPERIVVLPVGADPSIFFPAVGAGRPEAVELDVLFYGTFIPLHGIETIIRAARIIERREAGIRFELIGGGQQYAAMRRLAGELGAHDIRWTDWLPYDALGGRLRRASVVLGIFSGGTKASRVIPNKVHQALACGVPIVTRSGPGAEELLVNRESAMLVPPDDPAALAAALVELRDDPDLRARVGAGGRRAWEQQASPDRLAAIAAQVLDRIGVGS